MMKNYVLAAVVAGMLVGCGSDDDEQKTLIKWDCSGDCDHYHACAANESEALSASRCTYSSYGAPGCEPMGDICACPDGAGSCGIVE